MGLEGDKERGAHSLHYPRRMNARSWVCQRLSRAQMTDQLVKDELSGKVYKASDVDAIEYVLKLRKERDPWEVIEELIRIWMVKNPGEFQGFKIHLKDVKETRQDPKFGQTPDKNMERRLTIVFPLTLQSLIRKVYSVEELPFDRNFFQEFAMRFRMFQIPEQL